MYQIDVAPSNSLNKVMDGYGAQYSNIFGTLSSLILNCFSKIFFSRAPLSQQLLKDENTAHLPHMGWYTAVGSKMYEEK